MKTETCTSCGKQVLASTLTNGRCMVCVDNNLISNPRAKLTHVDREVAARQIRRRAQDIPVTTEVAHNLPVTERLGIIGAEAVFGMNIFKDVVADIRGTVGGRSKQVQQAFKDGREQVLEELKVQAAQMGADAIVGVTFEFNNIGSAKMLMCIATGTAVKLEAE